MKVITRYFAHLKEKKGKDSEEFSFPAPVSAEELFRLAFENDPDGEAIHSYVRVAVNQEYVDWEKMLADGDEIVFIPPVAGG